MPEKRQAFVDACRTKSRRSCKITALNKVNNAPFNSSLGFFLFILQLKVQNEVLRKIKDKNKITFQLVAVLLPLPHDVEVETIGAFSQVMHLKFLALGTLKLCH